MARSSQTERTTKKTSWRHLFRDHAGAQALRIGTYEVDTADERSHGPPSDYSKNPVFCFQVYTNHPLPGVEHEEQRSAKRTHDHNDDSTPDLSLIPFAYLGCGQIHEIDVPDPIWEIYTLPDSGPLGFVDHSRREIAHRKALRQQGDVSAPLIPKLQMNEFDRRKMAFLFGIDEPLSSKPRPLWIHFDERIPAQVTSVIHNLRLEEDPDGQDIDDIRVWPEQIDTLVKRVEDVSSAQFRLATMLAMSCANEGYRDEDSNLHMDFGLLEDDSTDFPTENDEMAYLHEAAAKLQLDDNTTLTRQDDGSIVITNAKANTEPDLQYTVYTPFLHGTSDTTALENTAKLFASAVHTRLLNHELNVAKTYQFTFHKPQEADTSAIHSSFRARDTPSDQIGCLTTARGGAPSANGETTEAPRRRKPIHINPHMTLNDPDTCGFEPYDTFLIVLDSPRFEESAAVRFILADGGNFADAQTDYLESQVWRSAGMAEVVRRLTLMPLPESELVK